MLGVAFRGVWPFSPPASPKRYRCSSLRAEKATGAFGERRPGGYMPGGRSVEKPPLWMSA